jgi:CelD/BcsL family acetyltransferase involved in cellulose biosynthesis
VHTFDPLQDPRWEHFLEERNDASVFHTVPWLEALRKTYGYQPVVYTSTPPGQDLCNGIVLCRVESWLTGRRLVSLPFSDHCEPLVSDPKSTEALFASLQEDSRKQRWRYVEMRSLAGLNGCAGQFAMLEAFYLHELSMAPSLDNLYRSFHKDCVQRKIQRAGRESLIYSEGRSETLLTQFYHLLLMTRRRHRVPPQPLAWFRNLINFFGESLKIRIACKGEKPVAGMLTLQHKTKLVFKYGCSDPAMHNLGGIHLLFWNSIREAKESGLGAFDLGRSEITNTGLITFKERWGAARYDLTYWKYAIPNPSSAWIDLSGTGRGIRLARHLLSHAPPLLLSAAGNLCYRHIG